MFSRYWFEVNVKKRMTRILGIALMVSVMFFVQGCAILDSPINTILNLPGNKIEDTFKDTTGMNIEDLMQDFSQDSLIRFHVVANSDSEEDQLLKYIVRDEILKVAAPRLAESKSLEESRQMLKEMEDDFIRIAKTVVQEYGLDYEITIDHGEHIFPAKSYGDFVLPGGEYEAVKIQIGEAMGENWWCVLFPPVCFVNVEESTTVSVDDKPGVPLDEAGNIVSGEKDTSKGKKPKIKFYLSRFF